MQWIESIDWVNRRPTPVAVDQFGNRELASLADILNYLPPRRTETVAQVEGLAMSSWERVGASEYLAAIGLPDADPTGHEVYTFPYQGRRVLVPVAALLSTLIGRMHFFGDRLLMASSLSTLAQPHIEDDFVRVKFHRIARLKGLGGDERMQSRFTWLTCFPSARRFWGSVYDAAVKGRLGCEPPQVTIDASFNGHRVRDALIVSRMSAFQLTPCEQPIPFASRLAGRSFDLFPRRGSPENLAALKERGHTPRAQHDIPLGPEGWKTTEHEWERVVEMLRAREVSCKVSSKKNIDIALEKHGSGVQWDKFGSRSAADNYLAWANSGKWAMLKEVLSEIRRESQGEQG